jgi:cytochrome o ubiquinol oxidase operon protein cyoD
MSVKKLNTTKINRPEKHSAKKYVIGYLLSLILTAIAFELALTRALKIEPLMMILMTLAGLQIVVQLYFFMHVTEGDKPRFHVMFLILGIFFTFATASLSVWIMTFNSQVS